MTNAELIEALKKLPLDAEVIVDTNVPTQAMYRVLRKPMSTKIDGEKVIVL